MKKVLVMLAEGFETIEALSVKDVCSRAGIECNLCGVTESVVKSAQGIKVYADIMIFDQVKDYDAIVIPGGMPGTINLRENENVLELIRYYYKENKLVAAICAGPTVLAKAKIIDDRNITSYPGYDKELGNVFYKDEVVVIDENILTSRGPATALEFSYAIISYLGYENKAKEIREAMLVDYYLNKL